MRIFAAIVFALFLFSHPGYAQNIDSLWILVHQSKTDSQKVGRYIDLAYAYRADSIKKSLEIARTAIQLASKSGFTAGFARAYNAVGDINRLHGKYDTAIVAYQVGLEIYKNDLEKMTEDSVLLSKLANCYLQIGNCFYFQGIYDEAIKNLFASLQISEKLHNKKQVSLTYLTIGAIHNTRGSYQDALVSFHKTYSIASRIPDKKLMGTALNNIGATYGNMKQYDTAYVHFTKALDLHRQMGNKKGMAFCYNNLGLISRYKGNYARSLEFLKQGTDLRLELGNKYDIAVSYVSTGFTYNADKQYGKAIEILTQSLKMGKELNALYIQRESAEALSDSYYKINNFKKGYDYLSLFKTLSDSMMNSENAKKMTQVQMEYEYNKRKELTDLDLKKKDEFTQTLLKRQKALRNLFIIAFGLMIAVAYVIYRNFKVKQNANSLLENQKKNILEINEELLQQKEEMQIQSELLENINMELEKLSLVASKADNAVTIARPTGEMEWVNEGFVRLYGYTLDDFVAERGSNIFLINPNPEIHSIWQACMVEKKSVVYSSETYNRDGEKIWVQTNLTPILGINDEIERIIAVDSDITKIKIAESEIEKQNEDITDSIRYASRIQEALLPSEKLLKAVMPGHFILSIPRDIVSGDFYWVTYKNHKTILVVADCTGHGVPGAFMSVLGMAFLREIVSMLNVMDAAEILNRLRDRLVQSLHQRGREGEAKDGIDMALCVFDLKNKNLQFSGANRPLYFVRNSEFTEYKPNPFPIGIHESVEVPFTNQELELKPGDSIYLTTDGYADQFGGKHGKKFMSKNLKELLIKTADKTLAEQKIELETSFKEWKGEHIQVDDVTIVGLKI